MAYGDLQVNNLIYDTGSGDATRTVVSIPQINSPTFTGTVTVPTPTAGDNSTKAATTAFVVASFATKASPTFTGTVVVPTATAGDNSTAAASTAFVVASFANLASPTFTGTPTLPTGTVAVTQSAGNSTTAIATTAFVATSFAPLASPTLTGTPAAPTASANTNTTQIATTAFVMTELGDYATLAAPAFTGTATGVNLTLSGNLTVNGTTTTIDTTNLEVTDKNIIIGKVSTPSDTTADGGGITLKGATDKTITWVNATDYWTFNQAIETTAGEISIKAAEGSNAILKLTADEGDDNADKWRVQAGSSGDFRVDTYSSGSWVAAVTVNGSGNLTGVGTISDSKGNLRSIPRDNKTSAYVLVATDAGKCISITTGGITINTSVFSDGDAVTIINHSGSDQTITQGSGFSLQNSADASTGNRTLAGRGMCTVYFVANDTAYISGAGLS